MKVWAKQGFTIVEILIVTVVVAILATLTVVAYMNAQTQAQDVRVRDAADKVTDAIQLFASKTGRLPRGGSGSSTAIGAATECANGAEGWAAIGTYTCTVEDTLVASGYLPAGFMAKLPQNPTYPTATYNQSLMLYSMGTDKAMVFYSQQSPTAADTGSFNAEMTRCGLNPAGAVAQRDTYGMRGGICFQYK
ncbi:hypothetical protein B7Z00_04920 [Candidatus Saccharibacteria bacterium 32-50-10]|nr:MAG: hypothetical protein B7Z00_04920 [Candidatus Saccharibacteria bacterium 32-50-10]